jgi:SAM-dependent methyltransferase
MPSSLLHRTVAGNLRAAYDGSAQTRSASQREPWKHAERQAFLTRLRKEGKNTLVEIGAGGGQDSQFFSEQGLQVVATDLSPRMMEMCRARGLDARIMDVVDLQLPAHAFEAAYSMNSLLHIPGADFEQALLSIRGALQPNALRYIGLYGGEEFEGVLESDWHVPQRFFSFRTDEQLRNRAQRLFRIEDFHVIDEGARFQSLTLRVAP